MLTAGVPFRGLSCFRGLSGVSARGTRPIELYKIASRPRGALTPLMGAGTSQAHIHAASASTRLLDRTRGLPHADPYPAATLTLCDARPGPVLRETPDEKIKGAFGEEVQLPQHAQRDTLACR